MDNLAKETPTTAKEPPIPAKETPVVVKATLIIAIAALVCAVVALILGIIAFKKSSEMDAVVEIKDANSVISESVAGLQEEVSGLSKKYATTANLKDVATSTQKAFDQVLEQLTKLRTQSRADTIKLAEIESRLQGGAEVKPSTSPSSSPSTRPSTSPSTSPSSIPTVSSTSSSAEEPASTEPAPSVPAGGEEYEIQSGDTLGKVAKQFGISLDKLMSANPGVQPRYLRVGQRIIIPE